MGINRSVIKSFGYAFDGLRVAIKEEPNFKIHTVIAIIAIILAYFLGFSEIEWIVLILTIFFVLTLEIVNTAVEDLADIAKPGVNEAVKKIKDLMAASVMLGAICALLLGVFLFLPKIVILL